jgi:hypothetical protein
MFVSGWQLIMQVTGSLHLQRVAMLVNPGERNEVAE